MGHGRDMHHRKRLGGIVIPGMISERPFGRCLAWRNPAFKNDLGICLEPAVGRIWLEPTVAGSGSGPPANVSSDIISGRGRAADNKVAGFAPRTIATVRLFAVLRPTAMMSGPAAMWQPAHDQTVPVQHLNAIDAGIVGLCRVGVAATGPGDDNRPGDQRPCVLGPVRLDRQRREINIGPAVANLLNNGGFDLLRSRGQCGLQHRPPGQRIPQPVRGRRGPERGQKCAQIVKPFGRNAQSGGDAFRSSEQVEPQSVCRTAPRVHLSVCQTATPAHWPLTRRGGRRSFDGTRKPGQGCA